MNAPISLLAFEAFADVLQEEPAHHTFGGLLQRQAPALPSVVMGVLHGFDLQDRPLVRGMAALPGEVVMARSTVALRHDMRGATVALVFEDGDAHAPIILGVVAGSPIVQESSVQASVRLDESERMVLSAEREVVLQCGDASITLTRAGRVVIRGRQILSAATGYNRIKGAAIDIN